jgi:dTDP-4-amino-4,6-dideoxygalactose transaminase
MKNKNKIAFSAPNMSCYYESIVGELQDVFQNNIFVDGKNVRELEEILSKRYRRDVIGVSSGTMGLILALDVLLKDKKEVIVPGISFSATVQAILHAGGIPVFADIKEDTWLLDSEDVKNKITENTGAIIPVNLFGMPCDVQEFENISKNLDVPIIYDSCQAFGASSPFGEIGSFGDIEVFSLDITKILSGGLGGLVVVKDDNIANKIRMSKNFGHNENKIPKLRGINGRMQEYSAIIAKNHLKDFDKNLELVKKNMRDYRDILRNIPGLKFQKEGKNLSSPQYFGVFIDNKDKEIVNKIQDCLNKEGIGSRIYNPSSLYKNSLFSKENIFLPNCEKMEGKILCLPNHAALTEQHKTMIKKILEEILA